MPCGREVAKFAIVIASSDPMQLQTAADIDVGAGREGHAAAGERGDNGADIVGLSPASCRNAAILNDSVMAFECRCGHIGPDDAGPHIETSDAGLAEAQSWSDRLTMLI
jgi:hypothetical protein